MTKITVTIVTGESTAEASASWDPATSESQLEHCVSLLKAAGDAALVASGFSAEQVADYNKED